MHRRTRPAVFAKQFCEMCGALDGDFAETQSAVPVVLSMRPRPNDFANSWVICSECFEGLAKTQNSAPQKPDRIQLLSQIRRASIDDQLAVLEWLKKKFSSNK